MNKVEVVLQHKCHVSLVLCPQSFISSAKASENTCVGDFYRLTCCCLISVFKVRAFHDP